MSGRGRVLLLLALAAAGCAAAPPPAPAPLAAPASASAEDGLLAYDRLYFGRTIPGGGTVGEEAWAAFLAEVVTPRFPDGLTAWNARGQWRDGSGVVIREETFVLELVHGGGPAAEAAVREIIGEYRARFAQESVMRVSDRVRVTF